MKKIISNIILIFVILFILIIVILSTTGLETNKFNKLISNKLSQTKNINLILNTIKFKINPTKLSLFLETQNPKIAYRDTYIPVQNIKVYVDFLSLLSTDQKLKGLI